ncbi:MAG: hypothetical protein AAFV53_22230, partial [Myxococcota bacterium]
EDAMAQYMAYHAAQFARIMEVLDRIPEGDGSLLDNTVVVWMSELADSWHGMDQYPVVLGGGKNSRLQTGQYVNYARTSPRRGLKPYDDTSPFMGVPHQKLLTTLCEGVGMAPPALGVSQVRGDNGETIDCTGNLPELLKG